MKIYSGLNKEKKAERSKIYNALNKDEKKENEYPDGQRRELFGKRAVEIGKKKDAD